MKRFATRPQGLPRFFTATVTVLLLGVAGLMLSCSKSEAPSPSAAPRPSDIKVEVRAGGPIVLTTGTAEFQVLPSGFVQATLLKDGKRLTLDEPNASGSDPITHAGKEVQFVPDLAQAKVSEATGKLGRGKRVEIPAHAADAPMQRTPVRRLSAQPWLRPTTILPTSRW
jgi:hypothetical protein